VIILHTQKQPSPKEPAGNVSFQQYRVEFYFLVVLFVQFFLLLCEYRTNWIVVENEKDEDGLKWSLWLVVSNFLMRIGHIVSFFFKLN